MVNLSWIRLTMLLRHWSADDCNIYVNSQAAAERTLASIQNWIEKHLRLKVNEAKSGTGRVGHRHTGRVNLSRTRLTLVLRPWSGTKVPRLSTNPKTANRNSAGEHRPIQSEGARVMAKPPEPNQ